jgi:hypothetical protein
LIGKNHFLPDLFIAEKLRLAYLFQFVTNPAHSPDPHAAFGLALTGPLVSTT